MRPRLRQSRKDGRRQLLSAGLSILATSRGVTIAVLEVPLCRILFPSVRSAAGNIRGLVCKAQGQWPASNKPGSVRQISRFAAAVPDGSGALMAAKPVSTPLKNHGKIVTEYSQ
jgi:hypothetical protein